MSEYTDLDRWLSAHWAGCDGWVEVSFKRANGKKRGWTSGHFRTEDLDVSGMLSLAEAGCDVYVGCCSLRKNPEKGRGTATDRYEVPGVWCDLDIGDVGHKERRDGLVTFRDRREALEVLKDTGLPEPSALIWSGGGMYSWWLLEEPLVLNEDPVDDLAARSLLDAVGRRIGEVARERGRSVDNLGDTSRVLRVPGTVNWKTGTERPVELLHLDESSRYAAEDLAERLGHVSPQPTSTMAGSGSGAARRRGIAPADSSPESGSLADACKAASWAEVLEPAGWQRAEEAPPVRGGAEGEAWLRPGKDGYEEGHSAVVYPDAPEVLVVFSDAAGLPSGAGQRLTKFRVLAWLWFNGDERRAARDLGRCIRDDDPGVWPESVREAARKGMGLDLPFVQKQGLRAVQRRGKNITVVDGEGRKFVVRS